MHTGVALRVVCRCMGSHVLVTCAHFVTGIVSPRPDHSPCPAFCKPSSSETKWSFPSTVHTGVAFWVVCRYTATVCMHQFTARAARMGAVGERQGTHSSCQNSSNRSKRHLLGRHPEAPHALVCAACKHPERGRAWGQVRGEKGCGFTRANTRVTGVGRGEKG